MSGFVAGDPLKLVLLEWVRHVEGRVVPITTDAPANLAYDPVSIPGSGTRLGGRSGSIVGGWAAGPIGDDLFQSGCSW